MRVSPQKPGSTLHRSGPRLLAASLGYSRMYKEDLLQLDAAMALFDA